MPEKNIVYFDLETQRSFADVGGPANRSKMGVSVAVTYSTRRGTYEIYGENQLEALGEELCRADLVVGWNHLHFDYPVLQNYVLKTLAEMTLNLDMMVNLEQILGFRLKLDSAATATLGVGKTAGGLDALRWWQDYQKSKNQEFMLKIARYCAYDVKCTRFVHEFGMAHGHLKYHDRNGQLCEVPVSWS
ncbi:MAG: helicase [Verrucomicrobia bacterium]|nr:MAG: helicase [Verrucomicrobiota bacterium]